MARTHAWLAHTEKSTLPPSPQTRDAQELDLRRRQVDAQTATIHALEGQLVGVKGEVMVLREHVSAGREREDSLTLEREMLSKQLEELNAAYVRDMAEARAHSAGAALLQSRLLETEGLLREAEAEIAELRRSVSSVLSRESTLVGKIMVARSEVVSAQTAKARADRLTQQQHMA
jgi:chromosome segregation ATPase